MRKSVNILFNDVEVLIEESSVLSSIIKFHIIEFFKRCVSSHQGDIDRMSLDDKQVCERIQNSSIKESNKSIFILSYRLKKSNNDVELWDIYCHRQSSLNFVFLFSF